MVFFLKIKYEFEYLHFSEFQLVTTNCFSISLKHASENELEYYDKNKKNENNLLESIRPPSPFKSLFKSFRSIG